MFPYHPASTVYSLYSISARTLDQEWKDGCHVWGPHAACPLGLGQSEGRCWCEGLAAWLESPAAVMLSFFSGVALCSAGSGYSQRSVSLECMLIWLFPTLNFYKML